MQHRKLIQTNKFEMNRMVASDCLLITESRNLPIFLCDFCVSIGFSIRWNAQFLDSSSVDSVTGNATYIDISFTLVSSLTRAQTRTGKKFPWKQNKMNNKKVWIRNLFVGFKRCRVVCNWHIGAGIGTPHTHAEMPIGACTINLLFSIIIRSRTHLNSIALLRFVEARSACLPPHSSLSIHAARCTHFGIAFVPERKGVWVCTANATTMPMISTEYTQTITHGALQVK